MQKAKLTKNEAERLQDLHSYSVLDTAPEINYDSITELASIICDTPIALISLVDEDRQWFKSRVGLDAEQTARDISFCGHAIQQNNLFEVQNSLEDVRFADNPIVVGDPKVIFYAGMPLTSPRGNNLGTLCVIDHKPKQLDKKQRKALEALSRQIISQLELQKTNEKLQSLMNTLQHQSEVMANQSRLASLGQMAGGIAHEVNNPLGIISLANKKVQKLTEKGASKESIIEASQTIQETVERVSRIIKSLRAISRETTNEPMSEDNFRDIIENSMNVCQEKFKQFGIQIEIDGPIDKKLICRSTEISQVLINLLTNSFHAIEDTKNPWIKISLEQAEGNYKLSVTDSGTGIPDSKNIMEPFYTTKPVGQGTGLGLSISKSIIEMHNGSLEYDSKSPNTKFDIYLPI